MEAPMTPEHRTKFIAALDRWERARNTEPQDPLRIELSPDEMRVLLGEEMFEVITEIEAASKVIEGSNVEELKECLTWALQMCDFGIANVKHADYVTAWCMRCAKVLSE
jgi:hypothetical protein